MEDLLTTDLSPKEKQAAQNFSLNLWQNLVSAYENENNDLEDHSTISPLALYNALEVIMKHDECFYSPKEKELKVQELMDTTKKLN